ncbi:MAG TPA: histidine kinase N-terminal domain-containing protein [Propionibacteriaceae bacterium]|nr:histidine kinase N-terminal domain-containing protein [Propionibacteriaceae bacterium]
MPSMSEVIGEHTALTDADHRWLKLVVSEWQLLADLSFSDLVLWVPDRDSNVFWAAAQVRPTTAPTVLNDDVVGDLIAYSPEHLVSEAFLRGDITQTSEAKLQAGMPVDTHAIPVVSGRVISVIEQHTSQLGMRSPSSLESSYQKSAAELAQMVTAGTFPIPSDDTDQALSPRVGDGYIRMDPDGIVEYASPNALSAFRRLGLIGDLVDEHLATLTRELLPPGSEPMDAAVDALLSGRVARRAELAAGDAHLLLRAVPLMQDETLLGTLVLSRDVSDLRSRERELVTKDATIREIHHRVKNNLQTVAALLRMQARRMTSAEAKVALNDAVSRVASIAIVHETLSQTFDEVVDFDRVADGLLRMVGDVASTSSSVSAVRVGSFGQVSAGMATSLSMVVTELCQNAVEHGLADMAGQVRVVPEAADGWLRVAISDNGRGMPHGFDWRSSRSLGLSIVSTLVAEMEGRFALGSNPDGAGTRAVVEIPLIR